MAYDRRSFAGAATATTITGNIDASTLSVNIADATGWPSGSSGDFFAVIDRGTATEEKVRVASRSSLVLTLASGGRGADGTSAAAHTSGGTIELCVTATDLDEANAHLADTALDHHTQYLNTTRHDVEARHTFGAALGTPVAAADIGTAASAGTGDNPAREDHVHQIGTGAIDTAGQFAAGVVDAAALATDAVTNAKIAATAVTADKLASNAVTTPKLVDASVTTAKIAANTITVDNMDPAAVPALVGQDFATGNGNGATETVLSTLNVSSVAGKTIQVPSMHATFFGDTAADRWRVRLRETNLAGTVLAEAEFTVPDAGSNPRIPVAFPAATPVSVAASTAKAYVVTIDRDGGTGAGGVNVAGRFSCLILPDPA